ncbi:MAG: amino acid ABC transporter permease [Clostridia bacterium]|nr:amino acid ABC transporter permease [Clostridia bacterium]
MFKALLFDLGSGFLVTCEIFALTLVIAIPLGLIVAFGSMSRFKPLKYFIRGFVWVIRGTPLMLQLLIVCYGPGLIGLFTVTEPMIAVIIAFSINYACYFSEIYRGGIESISRGQYEAGAVLGMSKGQTFFHVILPQVVKRIVPPMSNEIITLVKDTSLANTIAVIEIIRVAKNFTGTYAVNIIIPLLVAGIFYLVFVGLLTLLFGFIEKKMSYYKV